MINPNYPKTNNCKLQLCIKRSRIKNMRPLALNLSSEMFLKIKEFCQKLSKIVVNLNFAIWKKVLSNFVGLLCSNQERYSALVFLLDHNGQTRVYRLVLGPLDIRLWRKHDSPTKEDDCPHPLC